MSVGNRAADVQLAALQPDDQVAGAGVPERPTEGRCHVLTRLQAG